MFSGQHMRFSDVFCSMCQGRPELQGGWHFNEGTCKRPHPPLPSSLLACKTPFHAGCSVGRVCNPNFKLIVHLATPKQHTHYHHKFLAKHHTNQPAHLVTCKAFRISWQLVKWCQSTHCNVPGHYSILGIDCSTAFKCNWDAMSHQS